MTVAFLPVGLYPQPGARRNLLERNASTNEAKQNWGATLACTYGAEVKTQKQTKSASGKRKDLLDSIRSNRVRKLHDVSNEMVWAPKTKVYMFSLPQSSEHDTGSSEDEIQYLLLLEEGQDGKLEAKSLLELDKEMAHDYTHVQEILASKSKPVINLDKDPELKSAFESTTICNHL